MGCCASKPAEADPPQQRSLAVSSEPPPPPPPPPSPPPTAPDEAPSPDAAAAAAAAEAAAAAAARDALHAEEEAARGAAAAAEAVAAAADVLSEWEQVLRADVADAEKRSRGASADACDLELEQAFLACEIRGAEACAFLAISRCAAVVASESAGRDAAHATAAVAAAAFAAASARFAAGEAAGAAHERIVGAAFAAACVAAEEDVARRTCEDDERQTLAAAATAAAAARCVRGALRGACGRARVAELQAVGGNLQGAAFAAKAEVFVAASQAAAEGHVAALWAEAARGAERRARVTAELRAVARATVFASEGVLSTEAVEEAAAAAAAAAAAEEEDAGAVPMMAAAASTVLSKREIAAVYSGVLRTRLCCSRFVRRLREGVAARKVQAAARTALARRRVGEAAARRAVDGAAERLMHACVSEQAAEAAAVSSVAAALGRLAPPPARLRRLHARLLARRLRALVRIKAAARAAARRRAAAVQLQRLARGRRSRAAAAVRRAELARRAAARAAAAAAARRRLAAEHAEDRRRSVLEAEEDARAALRAEAARLRSARLVEAARRRGRWRRPSSAPPQPGAVAALLRARREEATADAGGGRGAAALRAATQERLLRAGEVRARVREEMAAEEAARAPRLAEMAAEAAALQGLLGEAAKALRFGDARRRVGALVVGSEGRPRRPSSAAAAGGGELRPPPLLPRGGRRSFNASDAPLLPPRRSFCGEAAVAAAAADSAARHHPSARGAVEGVCVFLPGHIASVAVVAAVSGVSVAPTRADHPVGATGSAAGLREVCDGGSVASAFSVHGRAHCAFYRGGCLSVWGRVVAAASDGEEAEAEGEMWKEAGRVEGWDALWTEVVCFAAGGGGGGGVGLAYYAEETGEVGVSVGGGGDDRRCHAAYGFGGLCHARDAASGDSVFLVSGDGGAGRRTHVVLLRLCAAGVLERACDVCELPGSGEEAAASVTLAGGGGKGLAVVASYLCGGVTVSDVRLAPTSAPSGRQRGVGSGGGLSTAASAVLEPRWRIAGAFRRAVLQGGSVAACRADGVLAVYHQGDGQGAVCTFTSTVHRAFSLAVLDTHTSVAAAAAAAHESPPLLPTAAPASPDGTRLAARVPPSRQRLCVAASAAAPPVRCSCSAANERRAQLQAGGWRAKGVAGCGLAGHEGGECLDLAGKGLGDAGVAAALRVVRRCGTVRRVDLSGNLLTDVAAVRLADALRHAERVETVEYVFCVSRVHQA